MSFQMGKHIGDNVYIHVCALNELPEESRFAIHKAVALTKLNAEKDFNAVKLSRDLSAVSLLDYEGLSNRLSDSCLYQRSQHLSNGQNDLAVGK